MKKLLPLLALVAIAAGCTSVQMNKGGDSQIRPQVVRDIVWEKFDVSDKTVTVDIDCPYLFGMFYLGSNASFIADNVDSNDYCDKNLAESRNRAYAKACEAAKCDAIVGARYKVTRENYLLWENIRVELTGYPASFKGIEFRPAFAK